MNKPLYYGLDGHNVVAVESWADTADSLSEPKRRVGLTDLPNGYRISTVFLGLDHGWGGSAVLLFETMVFTRDDWSDLDCERYSTWEEAEAGHARMIAEWSERPGAEVTP